MHFSRMRTAHLLPYGDRDPPPWTETPPPTLDRDPLERDPTRQRPPGQRPHGQGPPGTEIPLDRDPRSCHL